MNKEYLSKEEQYKKILNKDEIERIRDDELRSIRSKYWRLRHEVFLDERGISDYEFGDIMDELDKKEQKEIEEYRKKKDI